MRYPASEKLEIVRLVEQSHLGVRPNLGKPGIAVTLTIPAVCKPPTPLPTQISAQAPMP
jgi:hypothetical protein